MFSIHTLYIGNIGTVKLFYSLRESLGLPGSRRASGTFGPLHVFSTNFSESARWIEPLIQRGAGLDGFVCLMLEDGVSV